MSGPSIPRCAPELPASPRLIDAHAHLDEYTIERANMHWYARPLDLLDGFVRLGAYFTIGVEVFTSRHIQESARAIHAGQLLTETDNPNRLRMSFYSEFAEHYETIFPFREEVHVLLRQSLPEAGRRLLDAGCGTGHYCGRFAAEGFEAVGVDLDPAMVAAARTRYPAAAFHCLDMREVASLGSGFDLIFCIGNTAAHLTQQEFARFIESVKGILRPGGRWIFQVVNWDYILSRGADRFSLKTIEGQGATFEREYREVSAPRVRFCTRLRAGERTVFEGEVRLYPIHAAEVLRLHRTVGFSLLGHYADFRRSPFDPSRESGSVYVFSA